MTGPNGAFSADVDSLNLIADSSMPAIADQLQAKCAEVYGLGVDPITTFGSLTNATELGTAYNDAIMALYTLGIAIAGAIDNTATQLAFVADQYEAIDNALAGQ